MRVGYFDSRSKGSENAAIVTGMCSAGAVEKKALTERLVTVSTRRRRLRSTCNENGVFANYVNRTNCS